MDVFSSFQFVKQTQKIHPATIRYCNLLKTHNKKWLVYIRSQMVNLSRICEKISITFLLIYDFRIGDRP